MKKSFFLALLLTMLFIQLYSHQVDVYKAQNVAFNTIYEKGNFGSFDLSFYKTISNSDNDLIYIFNISPRGFVLVSADDIAFPILGYSFVNQYQEDNHPPQFPSWLGHYQNEISLAIQSGIVQANEIKNEWNRLSVSKNEFVALRDGRAVSPLCTTTWDQGSYYNEQCPANGSGPDGHVYAGCVATAVGQMMKYWNFPTQGIGSHSYTDSEGETYGPLTVNFGSTTYQWASMPNSIYSSNSAIATLLYHIGVAVDMDYNSYGSGAWLDDPYNPSGNDVVYALPAYFNYKNTLQDKQRDSYSLATWQNMLKADLDAGRPLVYAGDDGSVGHAFVCDGYDNSNNFHFNWGWSGSDNGYYAIDALNPGGYTFNNNQEAIFGIEPTSTAPGTPSNPSPANTATDVALDAVLSWINGSNTTDVDVYFSTDQASVTNLSSFSRVYHSSAISTFDPLGASDMAENTTYYWRIVDINSTRATTNGPVWSFTTVTASGGTPYTFNYHGSSIGYYWDCPDTYGDDEFGERYSPTYDCSLDSVDVLIYNTLGSPTGIIIHVYDSDTSVNANGLPGTELGNITVPIANVNLYPDWTRIDLSSLALTMTGGNDFFVTYSVINGVFETTQVNILSDDGTTGNNRSVEHYGTDWGYMTDDWGADYEFFMEAHVTYASAVPPHLEINPSSIDFLRTAIGGFKKSDVMLSNTGGGEVVITAVALSGDDTFGLLDSNVYPDTLGAGESITFTAYYGPSDAVTNSGMITVSETGSTRTDHPISLTGQGYNHNSWATPTPVFDQSPMGNQGDYSWSMSTSDAAPDYLHAENFMGIPEPITAIEFWGINWYHDGSAWQESDVEDPMTFSIKFYTDDATYYQPDAVVDSFSLALNRTTVDSVTFGGGPVYSYRAELPRSVSLSNGWISIQGTSISSPVDPWFLWSESPIGDLGNVSFSSGNWYYSDVDLAFSLYTDLPVAPNDLTITVSVSDAILSWTPDTSKYYNVYSDTNPYGTFGTLLGSVTDGSGTYTDPIGTATKKFYKVSAYTHNLRNQTVIIPAIRENISSIPKVKSRSSQLKLQ